MSDNYVPEIDKVTSDYYIACHYFPGWNVHPNGYSAFADIVDFPDRTPLLGFYDEANPEVFDWETKWACEHGINCFIYCWYRKLDNVGHPVTNDSLKLNHVIEARKKSRYNKMTDYAIMWEADNAGAASDLSDLTENLVPFWCKEYFSDDNYMKIDGKPVLFIYDCRHLLLSTFGGEEGLRAALYAADKKAKSLGLAGITFMIEYRGTDEKYMQAYRNAGFRNSFAYCYHTKECTPTQDEVLDSQRRTRESQLSFDPLFPMITCSVGWNPYPWYRNFPEKMKSPITQWVLTPQSWKALLSEVKKTADSLPDNALGKRMIILDNWNEWCEGHYIAPHRAGGFKYLQAVREVFTKCDNLPDYRLPQSIGLGPYNQSIKADAERIWYSF